MTFTDYNASVDLFIRIEWNFVRNWWRGYNYTSSFLYLLNDGSAYKFSLGRYDCVQLPLNSWYSSFFLPVYHRTAQGITTIGSGNRPQTCLLQQTGIQLCPEGIKVSISTIKLSSLLTLKLYLALNTQSRQPGSGRFWTCLWYYGTGDWAIALKGIVTMVAMPIFLTIHNIYMFVFMCQKHCLTMMLCQLHCTV